MIPSNSFDNLCQSSGTNFFYKIFKKRNIFHDLIFFDYDLKLLIDLLDDPLSQKLRKRSPSNSDINIFIQGNHTGGRFPFTRKS